MPGERAPDLHGDGGLAAHEHSTHRERRLTFALGTAAVVVLAEVAGGIFAHSTGLFADAGHNLADAAGLALALVAQKFSVRAPTPLRSFGFHRATILTAIANVGLLAIVTVLIVIQAVGRLIHPVAVRPVPVIVVALVALVANVVGALALHERADLSMRASRLHLVGDAWTSAGVALTGAIELIVGGWYRLDPAVSLAIALAIAVQGAHLARAAVDVLLESTPAGLDLVELQTMLESEPGVVAVHDLHTWSLSNEVRALSAHLVLAGDPSLAAAEAIGARAKTDLAEHFAIAHATLELETESEDPLAHRPREHD